MRTCDAPWPHIRQSGRASGVLNPVRPLSLRMIERLHDGRKIPNESSRTGVQQHPAGRRSADLDLPRLRRLSPEQAQEPRLSFLPCLGEEQAHVQRLGNAEPVLLCLAVIPRSPIAPPTFGPRSPASGDALRSRHDSAARSLPRSKTHASPKLRTWRVPNSPRDTDRSGSTWRGGTRDPHAARWRRRQPHARRTRARGSRWKGPG
jgi:hypothetical protein